MPEKFTKAEVDFESPAGGKDQCRDCVHFEAPNRCEIVEGRIDPEDWCSRFRRKSRLAKAFKARM
jgi:hypothetical protein